MAELRRDELLEKARDLAHTQAESAATNARDLVELAEVVVNDCFWSTRWMEVRDGTIASHGALETWVHRDPRKVEDDLRYLEINRKMLRSAAERYLATQWLHCRELDWLMVDMLTFAELLGTVEAFRRATMTQDEYLDLVCNQRRLGHRIFDKSVTIGVWGILFALSFLLAPYGPILVIAYAGWSFGRWYLARRKLRRVEGAMRVTYATLSTFSQGWHAMWDELRRSREQGASWDGIVYSLVEQRRAEAK